MTSLKTQITTFINEGPFNKATLAKECGFVAAVLNPGYNQGTGIPDKYLDKLLPVVIKYGFVPQGYDEAHFDTRTGLLTLRTFADDIGVRSEEKEGYIIDYVPYYSTVVDDTELRLLFNESEPTRKVAFEREIPNIFYKPNKPQSNEN